MTVRVFFHEQAPGPESDPGKVVPVSRTVPRSPEVAIAALNELLRGPTAGECAAGYWSFFSDDTAGMLRSVRASPEVPASPTSATSAGCFPTPPAAMAAPAPIAGRDGAAAVWTSRQLLVWGGNGRLPGAGLRLLRDGVAYDPAGDRWQPIPTAPAGVQGTSAVAA